MASLIKLAHLPCEVSDKFIQKDEFATRITNVLRTINFPERDKYIISYSANGLKNTIYLQRAVIDSKTGGTVSLRHSIYIDIDATDEQIIRAIFIVIGQFVIHELAENFRVNGEVKYDPHEGDRNDKMFKAVEAIVDAEVPSKSRFTKITSIDVENKTFTAAAAMYEFFKFDVPSHKDTATFIKWDESIDEKITPKQKTRKYFDNFLKKEWTKK